MKRNVVTVDARFPDRAAIQRAAKILQTGGLVAFPTETVYGLGAHALDKTAVQKIFAAKDRPDWDPLIVHVRDMGMARPLMKRLAPTFELLASKFWPGPLTLVVEKALCVPDEVTACRPTIALRMPWHPVAAALLAAAKLPIAAPSANKFGRPSPTRAEHVLADLGDRVDLILDAGPTPLGVESTVLDLTQSPPAILRPGGVSHEQLKAALGDVVIGQNVTEELAKKGLASPGMTIKHYAPRARVELFEDADALSARGRELEAQGRRIGIVRCEEDLDAMARTLFARLRELDAQAVDVILCALPPARGIGLAVRDRLMRAAGIEVKP
jgi:L-threonylcarbamoyladenylate synthase